MYESLTGMDVRKAAERDGLKDLGNPGAGKFPKTNKCLVALLVWKDKDFHWCRLDANGRWSHKVGEMAATDKDNDEQKITDPRHARLGPYEFVTFMSYCPDNINVS